MVPASAAAPLAPWYRELNAGHWRVLAASFLGWIFDGYETYALLLVLTPGLRQLLDPSAVADLSRYAGLVVAITLFGWALGGVIGGIVADYIGRKRTMMLTILIYAAFSGLTALVQNWQQLAACRLFTGVGLGAEWATGATLIAESWPDRARAKGQGMMQSAFGWGSLLAAGVWYVLASFGPSAWRYMFLVGAIPALFVLFIRRNLNESEKWLEKNEERRQLQKRRSSGEQLSAEQAVAADFTLAVILRHPQLRRLALLCTMMSLATTVGYWAISSWIPSYAESVAKAASAENPAQWAARAGLLYNLGAIVGYLAGGFFADTIGRRKLLVVFFCGSLLATPLVYLWSRTPEAIVLSAMASGAFSLGQFVWMAIYPPELFPTAVRGTAVSVIFNSSRFLSSFGPLVAGVLIPTMGGYSSTAMAFSLIYFLGLAAVPFLPETKGKPLPA
ncbi:MAG: MFS transporter [Bryobacteraceae bacterium]